MATLTPKVSTIRDQGYFALLVLTGPESAADPLSNVQAIHGDPNGSLLGTRGDLALDVDTATLYIKTGAAVRGDAPTNTDWVPLAGGGSDAGNDQMVFAATEVAVAIGVPIPISWASAESTASVASILLSSRNASIRQIGFMQRNVNLGTLRGSFELHINNALAQSVVFQADHNTPIAVNFDPPVEANALDLIQLFIVPSVIVGGATIDYTGTLDVRWGA